MIVQPYVVINGTSIDNIVSAYVIVEDHTYQLATASAAVDVCFQIVKVFKKNISSVSNHVWQFLEKQVYDFQVPNLSRSISMLIDKLNRF